MPRTATDKEMAQAKLLIEKSVEPAIRKMIDEFNKVLAPRDMRVGAELQWFIEGISDAPTSDTGKKS